mgnify:FL=1
MKQYKYRVNGQTYDVVINEINGKNAKVEVNGISFDVEMEGEAGEGLPSITGISAASESSAPAAAASAKAAPAPAAPKAAAKPAAAVQATGKGTPLKAPLPGVITSIDVAVGDAVKKGQTVVVLEAMKMQNNINAENDGTVTSIAVNKGDSVMEGTVLLTIG